MPVPKEQLCIRPLIQYAERKFQEGAGLGEVLSAIPTFQERSKRLITNVSPEGKVAHEFGTSTPVLAGIVVFEAVRHHLSLKGVQIPSSLDILSHTVAAGSLTPPNTGDDIVERAERHRRGDHSALSEREVGGIFLSRNFKPLE